MGERWRLQGYSEHVCPRRSRRRQCRSLLLRPARFFTGLV